MKAEKIEVGKFYRLKSTPSYTFVKAVEIIRPGTQRIKELANNYGIKPLKFIVVKCEHVIYKDDTVGLIKYFRPVDIIEE